MKRESTLKKLCKSRRSPQGERGLKHRWLC